MGAPVSYTSPSLLTAVGVATATLSFLMALGVAPPSPSTALGCAAPSQNSPRTLSMTRPTVPSTNEEGWMLTHGRAPIMLSLVVLSLVLAPHPRSLTHGRLPTSLRPMVLSPTFLSLALAPQRCSSTHGRAPMVLSPTVLSPVPDAQP